MFVLNLNYTQPIAEIEKSIDSHKAFLDKYYGLGKFICSGPKVPRTGGIILCKAAGIEELYSIIHEDPFFKAGLAEYELCEFTPTKYAENFGQFIKN